MNRPEQTNFLRVLFQKAIGGNSQALENLSQIAMGRNDHPEAQKMIQDIEKRKIIFSQSTTSDPRLSVWSEHDQELLKAGKKPHGYPEHPNV
jgi:hypothetical protein